MDAAHTPTDDDDQDIVDTVAPTANSAPLTDDRPVRSSPFPLRNYCAYFLFGVCNNFGYSIMLSAAHDIMKGTPPHPNGSLSLDDSSSFAGRAAPPWTGDAFTASPGGVRPWTGGDAYPGSASLRDASMVPDRNCNPVAVGAVLLADIVPAVVVKLTAPFFMHAVPYPARVAFIILAQAVSFVTVATASSIGVSLLGVAFGSVSSGVGELTFLALSAHFAPVAVACWSSGTGGAGILAALAYAGLTEPRLGLALSPRTTLLLMALVVPVVFSLAYGWLMRAPPTVPKLLGERCRTASTGRAVGDVGESRRLLAEEDGLDFVAPLADTVRPLATLSLRAKLRLMAPLLRYMLPLLVVYLAEYYINQGLLELLLFAHADLSPDSQYRWYQVLYQLGVFASRSSAGCLTIATRWLPLLAGLQVANAVLLTAETLWPFVPSIWLVFAIVLYEGTLGGAAYVNTFLNIRNEIAPEHVEFSLGAASMADSVGIAIAGLAGLYVHNSICLIRN